MKKIKMDYIYSYSKLFRLTVFQSSLFFVICKVCYNAWETYILVSRKPVIIFCHSQVISQDPLGVRTPNYQNEPDNRNSAPLMKKEFFLLFCSHQEQSQRGNGPPQSQDPPRRKFKEKVLCLAHVSGAKTGGLFTKDYCSNWWLSNMSFKSGCHLVLMTDFPPVQKFHTDDVYY